MNQHEVQFGPGETQRPNRGKYELILQEHRNAPLMQCNQDLWLMLTPDENQNIDQKIKKGK